MVKLQTKTSILTMKIQRLAKGLNKFSISDISKIIPVDEEKMLASLIELEKNCIIKKVSKTDYLYIKLKKVEENKKYKKINSLKKEKQEQNTNPLDSLPDDVWLTMEEVSILTGEKHETIRRKCKNRKYISKFEWSGRYKKYYILKQSIKDARELSKNRYKLKFTEDDFIVENPEPIISKNVEQKIFDSLPDYAKKHILKFLTVFKLAKNLKGYELKIFLKNFINQHPDYKISYSTFLLKKNKFIKFGIKGIIPKFGIHARGKSVIPQDMYDTFKKIYLSPKKYSYLQSLKLLKIEGFDESMIPSAVTFKRWLTKEYSQEFIDTIRNPTINVPKLNYTTNKISNKKISKKYYFKDYIKAADMFYEKLNTETSNFVICQKGYIKNHLNPYFCEFKISDITNDVIKDYISIKLSQGFAKGSIDRFLSTLSTILNEYANENDINCSPNLSLLFAGKENKILSDKEINKIKTDNIQKLWIICLGLTLAELAGLEYKDIDFDKKMVNINKFLNDGIVIKHRKKYKIRTLSIPKILFDKIEKNKTGRIFDTINIENYDILINTHITLLLKKNVQINIISKNMGVACLNDFVERFGFLLPKQLDIGFEILS